MTGDRADIRRPPTMSVQHLLRLVRMVGRYDWLGGYTHALLLDDGGVLGPECVVPNYRELSWATRHHERTGWCVVAVFAVDGEPETCAHCNRTIR